MLDTFVGFGGRLPLRAKEVATRSVYLDEILRSAPPLTGQQRLTVPGRADSAVMEGRPVSR